MFSVFYKYGTNHNQSVEPINNTYIENINFENYISNYHKNMF